MCRPHSQRRRCHGFSKRAAVIDRGKIGERHSTPLNFWQQQKKEEEKKNFSFAFVW